MNFTKYVYVLLLLATAQITFAQKQFIHKYEWTIFEDSLVKVVQNTLKKKINEGFNITEDSLSIKIVSTMLRKDKELRFEFSEASQFIKVLKSPNGKFRIVTWFFLQAPGYIVYRGVIQFRQSQKLIPLFDQVRFMSRLDNGREIDNMNTPERWYGALYYNMIPYSNFDKSINNKYLLIGKRQDHVLYDTKVLDVLTINKNQQIEFGDFFEIPKSLFYTPSNNRFVILHKKGVGSILDYNQKNNIIAFDALDTEKEEEKTKFNNKMYLIPTGFYHGFKFQKSFGWKYQEKAFKQMTAEEYLTHKKLTWLFKKKSNKKGELLKIEQGTHQKKPQFFQQTSKEKNQSIIIKEKKEKTKKIKKKPSKEKNQSTNKD